MEESSSTAPAVKPWTHYLKIKKPELKQQLLSLGATAQAAKAGTTAPHGKRGSAFEGAISDLDRALLTPGKLSSLEATMQRLREDQERSRKTAEAMWLATNFAMRWKKRAEAHDPLIIQAWQASSKELGAREKGKPKLKARAKSAMGSTSAKRGSQKPKAASVVPNPEPEAAKKGAKPKG